MRWGYRRPPVLPLLATAALACSPSPLTSPLTRLGRVTTGSSSGLSFSLTSGSATGSTSGGSATGAATSGGTAGATGTGVAATTGAVGGATAAGATSAGQGAGSSGSSSGGTTTTGGNGATCGCPPVKYCDPIGTPRCLDCLTDVDCASGTVCQASDQFFNYGQCVACDEAEPTCAGTEVCYLSLGASYHQCVADCRLATSSPRCPGANPGVINHCDAVTGTCAPGCAVATDCTPFNPLCDLDSGVGCAPPVELCAQDAGKCVQCRWASDCPFANPGCSYGYCGTCGDDTQCPPGLACVGTSCGCPDGGGCGGNAPVCILDAWTGPACGCQSSADCAPQESVCASGGFAGVCIPPCFDGGTDCSVLGQFCYFDGGLCGPCNDDSQCTGNPLGPYCIGPGCGCRSTADCAASSVCDGRSACIPSCAIDGGTDCVSSGQFCHPDSGLCGACESDSQCVGYDAGPLCLPSLGSCGCASTSDCGPNGGCEPGTSQCVLSCLLDDGGTCAEANLVCDPGSRVCVTCVDDSTCAAPDPYCANDLDAGNYCVECLMPSQCPDSTPGCDQVNLHCGSCTSSADCPTTLPLCQDRFCSPSCVLADGGTYCGPFYGGSNGFCQIATGLCVQCLQDADCQDPGAPFCAPGGPYAASCVQCLQGSDCVDGGPCNSQYFYCGACAADSDCPVDAPICISPPSGSCSDGGS